MNKISLHLHPHWAHDTISQIDVQIAVQADEYKPLLYPESGFAGRLPFAVYDQLRLSDDAGELDHTIVDAPPFGPLINKHVQYARTVQGVLRYAYTIYPRILPENYRSCPYYDFRSEKDGANGSGLLSLILPDDDETEYQLNVSWDLTNLPDGCSACWNIERYHQLPMGRIRFSYFTVGQMNCAASDSAKVYWLSEPEFDMHAIAQRVAAIYDYEKAYFKDEDSQFTIFIRRDPFEKSGGGTACPYAFLSGYSAQGTTDLDSWENVLVHEMTHTWPSMTDSVTGYPLTWFNEGMVEYYCAFIPWKGGFYSKEYLLKLLSNKATERYYNNKYRTFGEKEIEKVQWEDMTAQTVPYGRGFMYLSLIDWKLRKQGRSIDEVVIGQYRAKLTEQNWLDFIQADFGEEGVQEYHDMLEGKLIIPPDDLFEGFRADAFETEIDGETAVSYRWVME